VLCLRWNYLNFIWGGNSTYTVQPPSKHVYKRHIPRMSTSPPKWFMLPEIVLFELYTGNKHPTQNTTSRGFWGACKTNKQKVVISYGWMPRRTNSRPSLHTRSKSVQDKCLKGCNVLATEKQTKHIFAAFARTHGTISPHFRASAHCCPTFIFQVSSKYVQVWGSYNQKCFLDPKVILI